MSDVYASPGSEVSFGDIFNSEFFFDAFLWAHAVQLGTKDMPKKAGGGLAYSPQFARNRQYVLAQGAPYPSVLITDNCAIDTALGQGREQTKPRGRLLFAPITSEVSGDETDRSFGRFPLPPWDGRFAGGTVELRRCFMVDAMSVADHAAKRVASLQTDYVDELELRWTAYAARRGPFANARKAEKLAELLARTDGRDRASDGDKEKAQALDQALASAWRLEGALEGVAAAYDADEAGEQEIADLENEARELAEKVAAATTALSGR